jgi:hypothetical protein
VRTEPSAVLKALIAVKLAQLQQEHDNAALKWKSLEEQQAKTESLLHEVEDEGLRQQELHVAEVRQLQGEKVEVQKELMDALCKQEQQVQVIAQLTEDVRVAVGVRTALEEERVAEVRRLEGHKADLRHQIEAEMQETAHLRSCRDELTQMLDTQQAEMSRMESENGRLQSVLSEERARWEKERIAMAAHFEAEMRSLHQKWHSATEDAWQVLQARAPRLMPRDPLLSRLATCASQSDIYPAVGAEDLPLGENDIVAKEDVAPETTMSSGVAHELSRSSRRNPLSTCTEVENQRENANVPRQVMEKNNEIRQQSLRSHADNEEVGVRGLSPHVSDSNASQHIHMQKVEDHCGANSSVTAAVAASGVNVAGSLGDDPAVCYPHDSIFVAPSGASEGTLLASWPGAMPADSRPDAFRRLPEDVGTPSSTVAGRFGVNHRTLSPGRLSQLRILRRKWRRVADEGDDAEPTIPEDPTLETPWAAAPPPTGWNLPLSRLWMAETPRGTLVESGAFVGVPHQDV